MKPLTLRVTLGLILLLAGTGMAGDRYILKAPSTHKSIFVTSTSGEVNVNVRGWFCTNAIQRLKTDVKRTLAAIKKTEYHDGSTGLLKKQLVVMARSLLKKKNQPPEEFWASDEPEIFGSWTWQVQPQKRPIMLQKKPCYQKDELKKARDEAIRWAEYLLKEYRDAMESP